MRTTTKLRTAAGALALCIGPGPLAGDEGAAASGHSLVRLVCQQYSATDGELFNRVVIVEQTSINEIDDPTRIIDARTLLDYDSGEAYTGDVPARMRIYSGVSLGSDDRANETITEALRRQPASRDSDGTLMDFTGRAYRTDRALGFESISPDDSKAFSLGFRTMRNGYIRTNDGTVRMDEDGRYRCETPALSGGTL